MLGVYAQVAQALLARESLVVFYGNEVSLGAFFGSWLLWVAVGAGAAVGLRSRITAGRAVAWLGVLLIAMPALLALRDAGYRFVMITNQDGLGTECDNCAGVANAAVFCSWAGAFPPPQAPDAISAAIAQTRNRYPRMAKSPQF